MLLYPTRIFVCCMYDHGGSLYLPVQTQEGSDWLGIVILCARPWNNNEGKTQEIPCSECVLAYQAPQTRGCAGPGPTNENMQQN